VIVQPTITTTTTTITTTTTSHTHRPPTNAHPPRTTPTLQLTQDLYRLRAAYAYGPPSSLSSLPLDGPASNDFTSSSSSAYGGFSSCESNLAVGPASASAGAGPPPDARPAAPMGSSPDCDGCASSSFGSSQHEGLVVEPEDGGASDVCGIARELLAAGYLVQLRDEAEGRPRDVRRCLQQLRHRFIVCLGAQEGGGAAGGLLAEPLVIEPCFREQFVIAHPTPAYEDMLEVRSM